MSVRFGITLPQFSDDAERLVETARAAEDAGIDALWIFDHMWPLSGGRQRPILECWSVLSYLAGATTTIGIGTLVTRSTLRHPALLAKMAASVAAIALDRVTVAIGSGDQKSRAENEAFGLPYLASDERLTQLRATLEVVRSFFATDLMTLSDDGVEIDRLPPSPVPSMAPRLWVGGRSDEVLELGATLADGWNGWSGPVERFAQDVAQLRGYADGRPVTVSWGGSVVVGESDAAARDLLGDRDRARYLVGAPETIRARLEEYVEAGANEVMVTPAMPWTPETVPLLRACYIPPRGI